MKTSTARASRRHHRRPCALEPLESRRLMSGTWSTMDGLPLSPGQDGIVAMTTDGTGSVYAVGAYNGSALIRQKPSGGGGFVTVPVNSSAGSYSAFYSVFVDTKGNLFVTPVASGYGYSRSVLERPAGQTTFTSVNIALPSGAQLVSLAAPQTFAADSAGDVFAIGEIQVASSSKRGTIYTDYGTLLEMPTGQTSFTPVHQWAGFTPNAINIINSGPSAGMYVIGDASWQIEKSTNGGTAWTSVDNFNYDPNDPHESIAWALAGDSSGSGDIFVVGDGQQKVITGYKTVKVNGKLVQQPVYGFTDHWITRQSGDGGATWTTADDFQLTQTAGNRNAPYAVADLAGTVYVAGDSTDSSGNDQGIVRTNAGGTWQTADNESAAAPDFYDAVTIEPTTGTPYAGTADSWTIRSSSMSSSSTLSASSTAFSPTLITASNTTSSDDSASWLKTQKDSRLPQLT